MIRKKLGCVLCRSDMGDGGWSLHRPGSTDEQIASGASSPLLTGTAKWIKDDAGNGYWSRPNARDYRKAVKIDNYEPRETGDAWSGGFADNH